MSLKEVLVRLFRRKSKAEKNRLIWCNIKPTDEEMNRRNQYMSNRMKTSRYEYWSLIPCNLFEQFQKIANFYFLVLVIVLLALGPKAPVSTVTTMLPLVFVVLLTLSKQAYEDYQRHRSDDEVNNRVVLAFQGTSFVQRKLADIKIGDIIQICCNDEVPCDMVMLSSCNTQGTCSITTVNFDGETNLKTKQCVPETAALREAHQLSTLRCTIECEAPNFDLYRFNGNITLVNSFNVSVQRPLNIQNFLLRGSHLKNTDYINGISVYVGHETKLAQNLRHKRRKVSVVERKLNKFILLYIFLLIIGSTVVAALHYTIGEKYEAWYLYLSPGAASALTVLTDILAFITLLNYVIPISLYVTVEFQKFINAAYIDWDLDLYHAKTDDPAHASTSDIIEELGQVQYIFTDKTGTLTENKMVFQKCSIADKVYKKGPGCLISETGETITLDNMDQGCIFFFTLLCLCHTVETQLQTPPSSRNTLYKYMASSPDEVALLEACANLGIVYTGKCDDTMSISFPTKNLKFRLLQVLEFDPTRKRMSVIVMDENGEYLQVCKGAESHVIPLCVNELRNTVVDHINKFAEEGLRTLAITYRKLSQEEYNTIHKKLITVMAAINNREELLAQAYNELEHSFIIVGSTAVEDRLQDGVRDTISVLRTAGIKIWVLTGDKEETAVSVSLSCGHLSPDMDILYLCHRFENITNTLDEYIIRLQTMSNSRFAVVIDGHTLKTIMHNYRDKLLEIFQFCDTVLCCRMSPLQKSQIVRFVRVHMQRPVTLAIGDGANDCSMIQEAHVGVGIMGHEGRQAVYASDYAIHRFKYLKKLILVHGYNFYTRIVVTINYFFYKNILMITPVYFFIFFTGFSVFSLYSDANLTIYNTLCTSLPILAFGVFEQRFTKEALLKDPKIYKSLSNNCLMSWIRFALWTLNGIWQGLTICVFCVFIYNWGTINIPTHTMSLDVFSSIIYSHVVICATLQLCLITRLWNIYTLVCTLGSFLFYIICSVFISFMYSFGPHSKIFSLNFNQHMVLIAVVCSPEFWISIIIILPVAFLPYFLLIFLRKIWIPSIFCGNGPTSVRLGSSKLSTIFKNI